MCEMWFGRISTVCKCTSSKTAVIRPTDFRVGKSNAFTFKVFWNKNKKLNSLQRIVSSWISPRGQKIAQDSLVIDTSKAAIRKICKISNWTFVLRKYKFCSLWWLRHLCNCWPFFTLFFFTLWFVLMIPVDQFQPGPHPLPHGASHQREPWLCQYRMRLAWKVRRKVAPT